MTALVLGGGGPRGAVQIGMLQVLAEHGFVPDRIYGCSVGAVNGVGFACDPTVEGVERMTRIWTGINREHVFPQGRLHGPWLYFQQREAVYSNTGLRKIIEDGITVERLEDTPVPVEVVATSLTDGRERWFTYGPVAEAVLASAAMPAIFPPIEIEEERYIDGGVVNNVPIRRAIDAGATRIVVLLCNSPVYTPGTSRRPIEAVINALFVSIHARFSRDMAQLPDGVEVILCVGSEEATRDFDDFSTTEALIAHGREEASEVVRRYGLGSKAGPIPAAPTPAPGPTEDEHPPGKLERSVGDPFRRVRSGRGRRHVEPTRTRYVTAHHPGRHAGHHRVVGEVAADHRTGTDHHVAAEGGPREDHDPGPDPAPVADPDRDVVRPLRVHDLVGVLVAMVLVGDVDVRAGVDVVADLDREVTHDVAAPADHAAVADPDHRVGDHLLARHHPCREAHVRPHQGVAPDVDPPLAEERTLRKGQTAALAEGSESPCRHVARADGTVAGHPLPGGVHQPVGQTVAPTGATPGHRSRLEGSSRRRGSVSVRGWPGGQLSLPGTGVR